MVLFKELAHVSFIHPTYYGEDFYGLMNLGTDGLPVIIGYCGNLYRISITRHASLWNIDPSYEINPQYKVSIWDITNDRLAGEGDFDMAYRGGPMSYTMTELRKSIRNALIRLNTTSTNFYK